MPTLDAKTTTLIAVNEALRALDHEANERLATDEWLSDARDILVAARKQLTDKPWPELPRPQLDPEALEVWQQAKAAEQRRDGRL